MGKGKSESSWRVSAGQFWTVEHLLSPAFLLKVLTVLLCAFGLVMVFSASSVEAVESGKDALEEFRTQALYLAAGTLACYIVAKVGANILLETFILLLWFAVVAMLVAVLVKGTSSHGATRWIYIAGFSLQPSEFAKIVILMAAARILGSYHDGQMTGLHCLLIIAAAVGIPFVLIVMQKDLGTLIIVSAALMAMALLAGVRLRILLLILVLGLIGGFILIMTAGYRNARLLVWLDPYADALNGGWQTIHGYYAFASGGFFGLGLGNSRQKYSYLPEAENDFIFAIIGEELGFLGALLLIVAFCAWGLQGMRIAYQARGNSTSAWLMAASLSTLVCFQAFINMAGVTGTLPLTGRPLPFISAGGSSIVSCLIMVGLLLGVANDTRKKDMKSRAAERQSFRVIRGGGPEAQLPPSRRESHTVYRPVEGGRNRNTRGSRPRSDERSPR